VSTYHKRATVTVIHQLSRARHLNNATPTWVDSYYHTDKYQRVTDGRKTTYDYRAPLAALQKLMLYSQKILVKQLAKHTV